MISRHHRTYNCGPSDFPTQCFYFYRWFFRVDSESPTSLQPATTVLVNNNNNNNKNTGNSRNYAVPPQQYRWPSISRNSNSSDCRLLRNIIITVVYLFVDSSSSLGYDTQWENTMLHCVCLSAFTIALSKTRYFCSMSSFLDDST